MSILALCALQTLLCFHVSTPEPVRFGVPLPHKGVARGLRLEDLEDARLQWRLLQERPDPVYGTVWVELLVAGRSGTGRICAGGTGPSPEGGSLCRVETEEHLTGDGVQVRTERWHHACGRIEERTRRLFLRATEHEGEHYRAGEALLDADEGWLRRVQAVAVPRSAWERAGLVPPDTGLGTAHRVHLTEAAAALVELPGRRGAGDYGRSGGVVTNLEYDTSLGWLHMHLATGEPAHLARAWRCARHVLDRDMDRHSGLPHAHGTDHRSARPEPGHAWLRGMLMTGLATGDDQLVEGARTMAHALAAHPPDGEGERDRIRDHAWPLGELETWLAFAPDPGCARAADQLADAIVHRFDPALGMLRFGESAVEGPMPLERAWLTGGIVLPALRQHLVRNPREEVARVVQRLERTLVEQLLRGEPGLPILWRAGERGPCAVHRAVADPRGWIMLDGLSLVDLRRVLARPAIRRGLGQLPQATDPDLATTFSMLARTWWIWR